MDFGDDDEEENEDGVEANEDGGDANKEGDKEYEDEEDNYDDDGGKGRGEANGGAHNPPRRAEEDVLVAGGFIGLRQPMNECPLLQVRGGEEGEDDDDVDEPGRVNFGMGGGRQLQETWASTSVREEGVNFTKQGGCVNFSQGGRRELQPRRWVLFLEYKVGISRH